MVWLKALEKHHVLYLFVKTMILYSPACHLYFMREEHLSNAGLLFGYAQKLDAVLSKPKC